MESHPRQTKQWHYTKLENKGFFSVLFHNQSFALLYCKVAVYPGPLFKILSAFLIVARVNNELLFFAKRARF